VPLSKHKSADKICCCLSDSGIITSFIMYIVYQRNCCVHQPKLLNTYESIMELYCTGQAEPGIVRLSPLSSTVAQNYSMYRNS
jgi:hypothetical protein